jgi:hypothetical protein
LTLVQEVRSAIAYCYQAGQPDPGLQPRPAERRPICEEVRAAARAQAGLSHAGNLGVGHMAFVTVDCFEWERTLGLSEDVCKELS